MALKSSTKARGKKRARVVFSDSESESSLTPLEEEEPLEPQKPAAKKTRPKRAETKPCPICNEPIPLRLLSTHIALETERLDEIIKNIGSPDVMADTHANVDEYQANEAGPSSRSRRAAQRSRQAMVKQTPKASHTTVINTLKRHRKQRNAKLRDLGREEDLGFGVASGSGARACPVCMENIHGDDDVMEAHVDACLAHSARHEEAEREAAGSQQVDSGDEERIGNVSGLAGSGFHIRDPNGQDVEDDIDIDGDDEVVFGSAQFTEGDILGSSSPTRQHEDEDVDIDGDVRIDPETVVDADSEMLPASLPEKSLRDLVAEGKVILRGGTESVAAVKATMAEVLGPADNDKMDLAIIAARRKGNTAALVKALEHKLHVLEETRVSSSTSSICRICLDAYTEPTVSTGCWHACCRDCWLRCLGATKLCPICKRITAATELRRVYL